MPITSLSWPDCRYAERLVSRANSTASFPPGALGPGAPRRKGLPVAPVQGSVPVVTERRDARVAGRLVQGHRLGLGSAGLEDHRLGARIPRAAFEVEQHGAREPARPDGGGDVHPLDL